MFYRSPNGVFFFSTVDMAMFGRELIKPPVLIGTNHTLGGGWSLRLQVSESFLALRLQSQLSFPPLRSAAKGTARFSGTAEDGIPRISRRTCASRWKNARDAGQRRKPQVVGSAPKRRAVELGPFRGLVWHNTSNLVGRGQWRMKAVFHGCLFLRATWHHIPSQGGP